MRRIFFYFLLIILFSLLVKAENKIEYDIEAKVIVNPITNITIELEIPKKIILVEENLSAKIKLNKTNDKLVIIDLKYEIIKGNRVIKTITDKIEILDYAEKIITIPTSDLKPGRYRLKATATYSNVVAEDTDFFWIRRKWFVKYFFFINGFIQNLF